MELEERKWIEERKGGKVFLFFCFYFVRKLFNEEGARHTVVWESGRHEDSGEDDYVSAAEKTVYKNYLPHFLDRERTRTSIFLSARIWFFLCEVFCEGPIKAVQYLARFLLALF